MQVFCVNVRMENAEFAQYMKFAVYKLGLIWRIRNVKASFAM